MILYKRIPANIGKEKEILKQVEEAGKQKKEIILHTFTRRFIDRFSCVDYPEKPFKLSNFWVSGGIIYIKAGFNYKTISFDNIQQIEIN